ncbi:MAG: hypothetical protein OXD38_11490 [Aestuariivita sp.]|nr:hypothetical protein [Aestuariivita sp.]
MHWSLKFGLTVAPLPVAFLMEPLLPSGDWRWGVIAVVILMPGIFAHRRDIANFLSSKVEPVKWLVAMSIVGLTVWFFVGWFSIDQTRYRWESRETPESELDQAMTECRMLTFGSIEGVGGTNRHRSEREILRRNFYRECMRSQGFIGVRVDDLE